MAAPDPGLCPFCGQPLRLFLDPRVGPAPRPNFRCDCPGSEAARQAPLLIMQLMQTMDDPSADIGRHLDDLRGRFTAEAAYRVALATMEALYEAGREADADTLADLLDDPYGYTTG